MPRLLTRLPTLDDHRVGRGPSRRFRLSRTLVPPAASVGLHLGVLGVIALVGGRYESLLKEDRAPLAEVTLTPIDPAAANAPALAEPTEETVPDAPADPLASLNAEPPALDALPSAGAEAPAVTSTAPAVAAVRTELDIGASRRVAAPVTQSLMAAGTRKMTPFNSVSFAGLRARAAARIVYVVDGSGAVVTAFRYLQDELARSIDRLSPTQKFQVVFFREQPAGMDASLLFGDGALSRASRRAQESAAEWVSGVTPQGRSDPLAGLRRALALEPDLIFVLSSSIPRTNSEWGVGRDATLAELDRLNPPDAATGRRRVVIKTIQFLREDPSGLMRDIAQLHGDGEGSYRLLTYDDLRREEPDAGPSVDLASPDLEIRLNAAAAMLGSVETDGSAMSVLFGVPLPEQRASVARTAREALRALKNLPETDLTDPRLRLLRARAATLLAGASTDSAERVEQSREALALVTGLTLLEPTADAARRIVQALAFEYLGEGGVAFSQLTRLLDEVPEAPHEQIAELIDELPELGADPTVMADARFALVRTAPTGEERREAVESLLAATAREPFRSDPIWQFAAAEAAARADLADRRRRARALDPLLGLLARRDLIARDAERRALVARKIAAATDTLGAELDMSLFPALAGYLRGLALASDPARAGEAVALFVGVAGRSDAEGLAAEALWEAAALRREQGTPEALAESAALLARLAATHPGSPRAADARAAAIASTPDTPAKAALLRDALAADGASPRAPAWRLELARLSTPEDALAVLEPLSPGTREAAAGAELFVGLAREMAGRSSAGDRADLLARAAAVAERFGLPEALTLTRDLADAVLETDPARAEQLYLRLAALPDPAPVGGRDRLLIDAGRAQLAQGRLRDAFETIGSVARRLGDSEDRSPVFWEAWTILIEQIAARQSAAERAAGRAHLARLRSIDPALGGEPWNERLTRAQRQLDRRN